MRQIDLLGLDSQDFYLGFVFCFWRKTESYLVQEVLVPLVVGKLSSSGPSRIRILDVDLLRWGEEPWR